MNNYQKAIKVRKVCEKFKSCSESDKVCPYENYCNHTLIFFFTPLDENIKTIAKAIREENWKVD